MALTTPFFRVKMQQINHYTIVKKGFLSKVGVEKI